MFRKHSKLLLVVLGLLTLTSCNDKTSSNSSQSSYAETSSQESISSSSNKDSSSIISTSISSNDSLSSSSESISKDIAMTWSSEDLEDMEIYLNDSNFPLPFPTTFTSSYVNASGTDSDGVCFIVYDTYASNQLALKAQQAYAAQLVDANFTKEETEYDDIEIYSYTLTEYTVYIQIGVENTNEFVIYGYYEYNYEESDSFPYSQIASFYNVSENDAKQIVPAFSLDTNEKYAYYHFDEDDINYFYIGGYIPSSLESTIEDDYITALTNLNYTYNSTTQMYVNTTTNYEVGFMLSDGYFFVQISKDKSSSSEDATNKTIIIDDSFFQETVNGYPTQEVEFSQNNINFKFYRIKKSDNYIIISSLSKGSGYLYNSNSLGKITSIVVEAMSTEYYGVLSLYLSDSVISTPNNVKVEPAQEGNTFTYTVSGDYSYFLLIDENSTYASKNNSITINYLA